MTGSSGHQGVVPTLGSAPNGTIRTEIHASTTSGFTPSSSTLIADTWAVDVAPILLSGSNGNNFSSITKLPGGGSNSSTTAGLFSVSGASSNNAFVNVDIDYTYLNTTAYPALHLVSPAQNNVFHNVNFGRVANMLSTSVPNLWHSTAVNSVTGNRLQNIYAKHFDIGFNDQSLACKIKGIAAGNSFPTGGATSYTLGTNVNDDINVAKAQCYGSMFNEFYFGNGENLVVNGSFTENATGWTLGTGWSYGSNKVTHTSGTTTVVPNPALTVTATKIYVVTYTVSGRTTGSVTVSIGGVDGTARSTNGTFSQNITATGTGNLTFTPTTGFDGSIDEISVNLYNNNGALHVVFEDTQGSVKPYTLYGSAKFDNTGKLFMATTSDYIEITWPWKIKGVTGFRNRMPRLLGTDFGNNANTLDGLAIKFKIDSDVSWTDLTAANLVAKGALDATNGFDFKLQIKPKVFMKFSTQTVATYVTHVTNTVYISGTITWAVDQKVLYTTTGTAFGGLTNGTEYYIRNPNTSPTTNFELSLTAGGSAIVLTSDLGTGVHTFQVLFQVGETVKGATSFATGVISEVYYDTTTTGTLVFSSTSGSWVPAEVIRTNDLDAIKATNVVTNTSFALGPSFTSNINALQIATTVDQTKKYDAAIVTVTLTNIVPNSLYYIYNSDTQALVAQGTATGTPAPGESTIDYNVSVVYEENFDITVNVRKSSAPVKYLPYETGATVTSSGANVFIAQVVDTVVLDTYTDISANWTINVTRKTIRHENGTTVYSVKNLYSYLQDYFDNLGYLDDQVPMSASTPTEYNLINGWFIDNESIKYLNGGSITSIGYANEIQLITLDNITANPVSGDIGKQVKDDGTEIGLLLDYEIDPGGIANTGKWWVRTGSGTAISDNSAMTISSGTGAGTANGASVDGESVWSNIFTLGTIVSGTTLDVYQNDTQLTPWWTSNHIDILTKVMEAGTEIDSGNITILARKYGTLYDHFVIDATSGRNPVPLAAFTDGNNQTAEGTVGAYSGITFDFGYSSHDLGGGAAPYDVEIDGGGNTLLQIYEYLKYVTRTGSSTTFTGYGSIPGEYYVAVGDIRFDYDNEAVANFTEGERINGTGGVYGYLVSLLDSGTTGTLVLRNTHGTFTNNMSLTGVTSGTTALVNGTVTSITPNKTAPFGTYAGGTFFGARGVWLSNVASADANNYQLIDSTGTTQTPPATIAVTVNGIETGDKVSVFRASDSSGTINRTYMTSANTGNNAGDSDFVVDTIPVDTPTSGRLRIRNSTGTTEYHIRYNSWSTNTFTLRTAVTGTITAIEDVTGQTFYDTNSNLSTIQPGDLVNNTTDGSWAQIITVSNTDGDDYVFTHTPLTGGSDNEWDVSDNYSFHTLPISFNNTFTAYVPYIDTIATGTSVSVNVTYVADRNISTQVRRKGILPFSTTSVSLTSSGYTATAVRTTDTIVT
jgi:hypothetical protein